jgi:hypothetical protein
VPEFLVLNRISGHIIVLNKSYCLTDSLTDCMETGKRELSASFDANMVYLVLDMFGIR